MAASDRKVHGERGSSTFSDINRLLLKHVAIDDKEKKKDLMTADSFDDFKDISKRIIKITKKVSTEKDKTLDSVARTVRSKVRGYVQAVDSFMSDWKSIEEIQPIYSELVEIGKLATVGFIDCAQIENSQEDKGAQSDIIESFLTGASDLLKNFQEEHLILVLTNYFKMKENLVALHKLAEKESGYTEEERQARLFLCGVIFAVIGVIIVLLSAVIISFFIACGGSLPFLTYFYSCLSGSAATITSVSIATQVGGITASCYSCAVTMGPLFGFCMYKLIGWYWQPTEFQAAIKELVKEIEGFIKGLNKEFAKFQHSPGSSSNVQYLSREKYLKENKSTSAHEQKPQPAIEQKPQPAILDLLKLLGDQSSGVTEDIQGAFIKAIETRLTIPHNQELGLSAQLKALFKQVEICTRSIDKFEEVWPVDEAAQVKDQLIDIVYHVVDSYSLNFTANFRIKDRDKQTALLGILTKTEELLTALSHDDIVVILAKYFEMMECLDELKRQAEAEAGWSEEKRKAALYLCGIVTALLAVVAVFLLVTTAYFWLHLGGAFYFGHFLASCLKGASAIAAGCYSFACIGGPAVSYLFYNRIIDKIIPRSPLQFAIAELTTGTKSFIKALWIYSKTSEAKKEISQKIVAQAKKEEEKTKDADFHTPCKECTGQIAFQKRAYFSRRDYLRTAEKRKETEKQYDLSIPRISFEPLPSPP